ncbi:hypothetical protein Tco_0394020, partial [Tanacetum coccineum]
GLRGSRKLNKGALDLYVGNGNHVVVEAIGSFDLMLPSGMVLVLDNYYGAISVYKDNLFYFNVIPCDDIFEIDMHNHVSNEQMHYKAASEAVMEAIWIHKFISGLGIVPSNDRPMDMYCDHIGAITIADEHGFQNGAKHFR